MSGIFQPLDVGSLAPSPVKSSTPSRESSSVAIVAAVMAAVIIALGVCLVIFTMSRNSACGNCPSTDEEGTNSLKKGILRRDQTRS